MAHERVPVLVVGPIREGSIVVVRRPPWADEDLETYAEWATELLKELERIAGHQRFTVYFVSDDEGGVAVVSREELAAVFAKEAQPCPTT